MFRDANAIEAGELGGLRRIDRVSYQADYSCRWVKIVEVTPMTGLLRNAVVWTAVLAVLMWTSGIAAAQIPYNPTGGPGNPPAYSPYLNLLNRGQTAGANYYGLVKPELEFRNAYRGLQQQIDTQQYGQQQTDQRGLPTTGHAATFMNYRQYFLTNSPGIGQRPGLGQGQQFGRQIPQGAGQGASAQGSVGQGAAGLR